MTNKICTKCKIDKEIKEFAWKIRNRTRQSTCKQCTRERSKEHYYNNKIRYKKNRRRFDIKIRQFVYDYYSTHPCVDCGESNPIVLQFDHNRDKKINISYACRNNWGVKKLAEEIAKCNVRCANCHLIKTSKEQNWYSGLDRS